MKKNAVKISSHPAFAYVGFPAGTEALKRVVAGLAYEDGLRGAGVAQLVYDDRISRSCAVAGEQNFEIICAFAEAKVSLSSRLAAKRYMSEIADALNSRGHEAVVFPRKEPGWPNELILAGIFYSDPAV